MMLPLQVWKDNDAPAIALLSCYIKKYGTEALGWEPAVARKQIEEDYVKISDLQSDKLQAAITVLTTPYFESDWHVFQNCCHAFSNIPDSFEDFEPLDPEEIIVGVAEATMIRDEKLDFHDEVNAYVGTMFHNHGFSKSPELFPSSIMPKGPESDDTERNEELSELFDFHLERASEYLDNIS
jgi:hypothetical protein